MGTLSGSRSDFGAKPAQNAEYIHFQYTFDTAKCLQLVPNRHFPSLAYPAHIAVQRSTGGFIMSISEAERFDMQVGLRSHLGDHVANILMEHLPPSGWSDVARKQDFEPISYRIGNIEKELTRINSTLKVIIGGVLTVSTAIIVLLIQLNQNISSL